MQKVNFTFRSYELSGNFVPATEPKEIAFLFIEGWTGRQDLSAAQALAALGFTSMTYDMRGTGESDGELSEFSRNDFVIDAIEAYDFLKKQVGADVAIGAIGTSFGSYTAILLSKQRPVECLSLHVPASYPDKGYTEPQLAQVVSAGLTAWRNQPLDYDNYAFKALHNFRGNVQIIEAEYDERIPHQAIQNYVDSVKDKNRLEYDLIHDAHHVLDTDKLRVEYIELLSNWAVQLVR